MTNLTNITDAINNNDARELASGLATAGVSARWNAAGEYVEVDGWGFITNTGSAWAVEGHTLGTLEVLSGADLADELNDVVRDVKAAA